MGARGAGVLKERTQAATRNPAAPQCCLIWGIDWPGSGRSAVAHLKQSRESLATLKRPCHLGSSGNRVGNLAGLW